MTDGAGAVELAGAFALAGALKFSDELSPLNCPNNANPTMHVFHAMSLIPIDTGP